MNGLLLGFTLLVLVVVAVLLLEDRVRVLMRARRDARKACSTYVMGRVYDFDLQRRHTQGGGRRVTRPVVLTGSDAALYRFLWAGLWFNALVQILGHLL